MSHELWAYLGAGVCMFALSAVGVYVGVVYDSLFLTGVAAFYTVLGIAATTGAIAALWEV